MKSRLSLTPWFLSVSMLVSAAAYAQPRPQQWYIGGGIGGAEVQDLCRGIPDEFCEDTGLALRGFAGWRVNRNFALEAAFNFASGFVSPGARVVGYDGDTDVSSFGVNAIGFLPVGSRVALMGGLSGAFGIATTQVTDYRYRSDSSDCDWYWDSWDDEWEYYCRNNSYDDEYESDASLAFGALLGVEVQVTKRFYLRAQAQRFFDVDGGLAFMGERDVDFVTANVLFEF
ncbi:MAG: outer membrane beta-barrel protein [Candidatus Obscuribacterales bacterium]|nr:outer membrane beta-barrel protein [Steroidobacteraceae bacterium]